MDFRFESMRKKRVACILLVCCLILFAGCDYTKYPLEIKARWVSTNPDFTLEYQGEYPYEAIEYLNFNGEQLSVYVLYFPSDFKVIPASAIDNATNTIYMSTVYLRGRWKLRENELIFYIKEDNLFNGMYEEIHFTREELE